MNFQKLPNGSYDYVHVGDWNNGTVTFQKQLQFTETVAEGRVESVCSKPCAPGFYRVSQLFLFFFFIRFFIGLSQV